MTQLLHRIFLAVVFAGIATAPTALRAAAAQDAPLQGVAWKLADEAYKAYDAKRFSIAETKVSQALKLRPDATKLWLLRIYAVQNQDRTQDALNIAEQALTLGHSDPALIAARDSLRDALRPDQTPSTTQAASTSDAGYQAASLAYAASARKDYAGAAQYALTATQESPDNLSYRLLLVNSLALAGKKEQARAALGPVMAAESLPATDLLSAAYAAQHLSYNDKAITWFSQSIDAGDAGEIEMDETSRNNIRNAISDLDRSWGYTITLGYGSVGLMDPAYTPSLSRGRTLQASEEIYWRPPGIGLRDGSRFELYARSSLALYDRTGGATGLPTWQGAAGARWKPLGRQNFVLAAERLFRIGQYSRNDWLLRAAWSAGEGGALRTDKTHWPYWQLYAEADYFISNPQTLATVEGRYGHSYRVDAISPKLVISPFLGLNLGYDSLLNEKATAGIGPGVNLRYWFRQDKYHAPQSYIDFSVQYRVRVAGDVRSNGIFAGLSFSF